MLRSISIKLRLAAIVMLGALGLIVLGTSELLTLRAEMLHQRKVEVQTLVDVAVGKIAGVHQEALNQGLSEEQAQHLAMEGLRGGGYGDGDYFFILDTEQNVVMHGVNADLEGRNFTDTRDPNGVALFVELTQAAETGGDFVDYHWTRDGSEEAFPKVSYADMYTPWQWVVGTGVYIDDVNAAFWNQARNVALICLAVILVTGLVAYLISMSITRAVGGMTGAMHRLAQGDTELTVPALGEKTEIGHMADAVEVFRQNAVEKRRLEVQQAEAEARAEAEQRAAMNRMADEFEAGVGEIVSSVTAAAQELQASANSMSAIAEETSVQSSTVAASAEQASANVQTVAAASEELGSSIGEISRQMTQQTDAADAAVAAARTSDSEIKGLAEQVDTISSVVSLITTIAEQTNLLALNATIEAARAGEAGKGFAVVASEVKTLANQTAKATDEISSQIQCVQAQTGKAVTAIADINERIERMQEISASIAAAVEEQSKATAEIGRNTQEASAGTQEVAASIDGVREASREAGENASTVLAAAGDLSEQSAQLSSRVSSFLEQVRAA